MQTHYDYDLDPVDSITVGAIGPPGERTFYLQGAKGREVVSILIEKEHADALAASIDRLVAAIARSDPEVARDLETETTSMDLVEPVEAAFRATELGLGVDEERNLIVLVAHEVPDDEPGRRARFVGTCQQMLSLSRHATDVVRQGRPICELCGEPIGPEGHFCIRRNGHNRARED